MHLNRAEELPVMNRALGTAVHYARRKLYVLIAVAVLIALVVGISSLQAIIP